MRAAWLAALLLMGTAAATVFRRGSAVSYGGRPDARTGRSVDVLIDDRGRFGNAARVIDVSRAAAGRLGILAEGVAPVTLAVSSSP